MFLFLISFFNDTENVMHFSMFSPKHSKFPSNSFFGEFWRIIKPFLSDKVTVQTKIQLVEKGKLLSNETKVTETFNSVFENTANKLRINRDDAKFNYEPVLSTIPIDVAIQKFSNQPSVKLIRDYSF